MSQDYTYNGAYYTVPADQAYNYVQQSVPTPSAPAQPASEPFTGWVNFKDTSYLKGFVVGAGVALVVANPAVQKAVVSGAVKLWSTVQGGVEEVKEQVKDIRAEISQSD